MHLRLDHIEGVGEKGRRNARRNTRGEVEKGNGNALVRIVDLHDVRLDGVVDADVQTRVRSISQDGGNQTREESPLVLLHHILAGVKDGVVRNLIVLTRVTGSIMEEQIDRAQKPAPREYRDL